MDNNQMCNCRRCNGIVHEIKRGDTLYNLSRLYNVSVGNILKENKGINPYNLMIGEKICIPMRVDFNPLLPNRRDGDGLNVNESKDKFDYEMKYEKNYYNSNTNDEKYDDNDEKYNTKNSNYDVDNDNYDIKNDSETYRTKKSDESYSMKDKYIQNERNMEYDVEYRTSDFDSITLKELVMNRDMSVSEFVNIIKNYL